MSDILAVLAAGAVGYYALLDPFEPRQWLVGRLHDWFKSVRSFTSSQSGQWLLSVGLPALAVGLLALALDIELLSFAFDTVVLVYCMAVTPFLRNHRLVVSAVYGNDAEAASQIANEWDGSGLNVEDGRSHFVPRMLGMCATRLHEDIIAVLVMYVLFGAAGAFLFVANSQFFRLSWVQPPAFDLLDRITAPVSIVLFGICGNMGPALAQLFSFRPDSAALAAGGIDAGKIDLEVVPAYGKLLLNTCYCCLFIAVVVLLFLATSG